MFISKKQFLSFAILILGIYFIVHLFRLDKTEEEETTDDNTPILNKLPLQFIVVHFDLKAMAPSTVYLNELLINIKKLRVTWVLLEYGDLFPYKSSLQNIKSVYSYSRPELSRFLESSYELGFTIIPLVDTLGQMEYALEKNQHLMEMNYTDSICPSKEKSKIFLKSMLKQVIDFHQENNPINYLHIGCGKDAHVNHCDECKSRGLTDLELYIDHIYTVSNIVKSLKPSIKILIWDDIFRNINKEDEAKLEKIRNIQIVYRDFNPIIKISSQTLSTYKKRFANVWAASGFRGVDGPTSIAPDLDFRYSNHFSWLTLINSLKDQYKFNGLILIGKSRYNHSYPPCDILPASYPSLILNLVLINKFKAGAIDEKYLKIKPDGQYTNVMKTDFKRALKCSIKDPNDFGYLNMKECRFQEFPLLKLLLCLDFRGANIVLNLLNSVNKDNSDLLENLFGNNSIKALQWCSNYDNLVSHSLIEVLENFFGRKKLMFDYADYRWNISRSRLKQSFKVLKDMKLAVKL